jgi:hypothetical protein
MRLIGIEEHFLTPHVEQGWQAMDLAASDPSVAFHGGARAGGCWIWPESASR